MTEFLPVSSSGHLVLMEHLLGTSSPGALTEAVLHLGTLLPILIFFRAEVGQVLTSAFDRRSWRWRADNAGESAQLFRFLAVATIATMVVAFPAMEFLEGLYDSPRATGVALLFTTGLLVLARLLRQREPAGPDLRISQAVFVGIAQALAITPGVSRSGTTIVIGLLVGIPLARIGACSFLLAVPAVLGGTLIELIRHPPQEATLLPLGVGFSIAAISGWLAVKWTVSCIRRRRLEWFAPYTGALALVVLFLT